MGTTRLGGWLGLAVTGMLIAAAPATADVRTSQRPLEPVFGGAGVLWLDATRDGGLDLRTAAPDGQPSTVQAFRPEPGSRPGAYLTGRLAASGSRTLLFLRALYNPPGPDPVEALYAEHHLGPPGGPLQRISRCGGLRPILRSVDVSGDAYAFRACERSEGGVEIRDEGAPPQSPARTVGSGGAGARIAGRYVAWLDGPYEEDVTFNSADLVVYDRVAGAEAYRLSREQVPGRIYGIDVQEDGRVAFVYRPLTGSDRRQRVGWASPEEPHLHALNIKAAESYEIKLTGGLVAFVRGEAPNLIAVDAEVGVSDLNGNERLVARGADDYGSSDGLDFDGQRIAFIRLGCSSPRIVVRDVTAPGPLGERARCPLRLDSPALVRRGTARFTIRCRAAVPPCAGPVSLRTVDRFRVGGSGSKKLTVGSGSIRSDRGTVKISKTARTLLARRGRLRVRAVLRLVDRDGRFVTITGVFTLRAA